MRITLLLAILATTALAEQPLPLKATFQGTAKFQALAAKAQRENWRALPIGDRMAKIGLELKGTPYKGFTLEIHDRVESPSANFNGQDCWTFFEICLGMARMLETPKKTYTPGDLLDQIEWTRYRDGQCRGNYLDRIHYLAEWYIDNDKRKTVVDITRRFPTQRMPPQCGEMTRLWKHYRYLKMNPELRAGMAHHEQRLNKTPVFMVPKDKVAGIEPKLQNGDIIGIARHDNGSYCSHVGIIIVDQAGQRRFMHASTTYKKVTIDSTISAYLNKFKKHAGILVARPLPAKR
ncbi:MAG: N-acetylmuramoyl-L-alanine amidase-like domain-containing protein [Akkermansiaceae bacterium]